MITTRGKLTVESPQILLAVNTKKGEERRKIRGHLGYISQKQNCNMHVDTLHMAIIRKWIWIFAKFQMQLKCIVMNTCRKQCLLLLCQLCNSICTQYCIVTITKCSCLIAKLKKISFGTCHALSTPFFVLDKKPISVLPKDTSHLLQPWLSM